MNQSAPHSRGPESIDDALARLSRYHPKKIDLSLGRLERLLDALGRPQDRLPPTIHIAGTNGKGSTAAFLRAISQAAGESVHVYTSPHLVRFNERIVLASEVVDDARLTDAFARCEAANGDQPITFFEATTAAALLLFSETRADRLILEVGLGGLYDATNIVDRIQCSVITPVSMDHEESLGDTLAKIATEKAGIIKPGTPVVVGRQAIEARSVIDKASMMMSAPIAMIDEDFRAYSEHGRLVYEEDDLLMDLPRPGLIGPHQFDNAALAIKTARLCGYSDDAIAEGIEKASWPARMQRLTHGTLANIAHQAGTEIWLDGGHNPGAAQVLATAMSTMDETGDRPLVLVSAFSANKHAKAYFEVFSDLAARVIAITFAGGREGSKSAQETAGAARAAGIPAQTAAGLQEAIHDAIEDHVQARIVICGSLYLAGEVLSFDDDDSIHSTPG
jgi:dihydrofolate synthase/folylpolyglutamate synthase